MTFLLPPGIKGLMREEQEYNSETHSEACLTSNIELFAIIVNGIQQITGIAKDV